MLMLVTDWGQKQPASQIGWGAPGEFHSSLAKLRSRKVVELLNTSLVPFSTFMFLWELRLCWMFCFFKTISLQPSIPGVSRCA